MGIVQRIAARIRRHRWEYRGVERVKITSSDPLKGGERIGIVRVYVCRRCNSIRYGANGQRRGCLGDRPKHKARIR